MKTNLVIPSALICQSLCAQVQSWVYEGSYEMRSYDTNTLALRWWKQQILDPGKLTEIFLTSIPTRDYDRRLEIAVWYGGKQTWAGTNRTEIIWSNGVPVTNCLEWWSNGRWDTGGNVMAWSGTDLDGNPYDLECWANMAVLWKTNDSWWSRCLEHDEDRAYVLGLYRTNRTITLSALSECNVPAGQTNFLPAPEGPDAGRYEFRFMNAQSCPHCGQGCALPWTMTGKPRNPNAIILTAVKPARLKIDFPARGRENKWTLETSDDARTWTVSQEGIAPLKDRVNAAICSVQEAVPESGARFYRVRFSRPAVEDAVREMFSSP